MADIMEYWRIYGGQINGLKVLTMGSNRTQPPYLQAHLKTAQATARPKFLKELAKPTQERISIFFPTL